MNSKNIKKNSNTKNDNKSKCESTADSDFESPEELARYSRIIAITDTITDKLVSALNSVSPEELFTADKPLYKNFIGALKELKDIGDLRHPADNRTRNAKALKEEREASGVGLDNTIKVEMSDEVAALSE